MKGTPMVCCGCGLEWQGGNVCPNCGDELRPKREGERGEVVGALLLLILLLLQLSVRINGQTPLGWAKDKVVELALADDWPCLADPPRTLPEEQP